jgi:hypothetical protein
MNMTKEQALRIAAQVTVVLLILVAAYAVMLHLQVGDLETSVSQAQADTQKAVQDASAARKKLQDELNAANAKAAAMEAKLHQADGLKALLAKVEPQVAPALEAAAKAGKPETRSALLAGEGLIGQIVHGADHDASLGVLVRALALDRSNCAAALGINLLGTKTVEVPAGCEGVIPAAPSAKPAAAAAAAPAAAPTSPPAAPAAPPAQKAGETAKAAPAGKG